MRIVRHFHEAQQMRFQAARMIVKMTGATALANAARLIIFAVSMCSVSHAATMDDYVTCGLVYGALFQAAKKAQHDGMLLYSKPRLQAVLPYLQKNKDNPRAKEKLRETATRLEDEVKNVFVRQAISSTCCIAIRWNVSP